MQIDRLARPQSALMIGLLIEVLTVTGFAPKLTFAMLDLANGRLFTLAIVVALSCLIFGLGLTLTFRLCAQSYSAP